jgi:uncharacterized tellurite resistance protein B-like protein
MQQSVIEHLQEIQNLLNQLATMQLPEADDLTSPEIMDILDMNELDLSINCMLCHVENDDPESLKLEVEYFSKILQNLYPRYQDHPILEKLQQILAAVE